MFRFISDGIPVTGRSIPEVLNQLPFVPSFNREYLRDYFLFGFFRSGSGAQETLFEGIARVPAKNILGEEDTCPVNSFQEAQFVLLEQLLRAVTEVLPNEGGIGVELSGGLDSSSIAALIRKLCPTGKIFAFTHGVPRENPLGLYDETYYSRFAARALSLNQVIVEEGYSFDEILDTCTDVLGSFSEVLFPLLNYPLLEMARARGVTTLLSGFGGDEVVSQHAKLHLRELKNRGKSLLYLYERVREKKYQDWLRTFRLASAKKPIWKKPTEHLEYLHREHLQPIDALPNYQSIREQEHAFIDGALSTHWQRRIETSQILARHFDIDYRFPLADPNLMRFFHRLPSHYKRRHGKGRYLMRYCMKGLLPQPILWREDKAGATAPAAWTALVHALPELFLRRTSSNSRGIAAEYVNIPKLRKRFEKGFVDQSGVVRLAISVLMLEHLEQNILKGAQCLNG